MPPETKLFKPTPRDIYRSHRVITPSPNPVRRLLPLFFLLWYSYTDLRSYFAKIRVRKNPKGCV